MSVLYVIFKVGESEYAVPADEVAQMDTYSGATPVPGSAPYVAGLVQIRQKIIPVLDIRARFGLSPLVPTLASRIVVLKFGERLVGIAVDSAREVQNIPAESLVAPPEVVSQQSNRFVKAIIQLKDRIVMLLDTPKVIGEGVSYA